jgi:hypothetical protein
MAKDEAFFHGRGRIQSLSPARREVWREVLKVRLPTA